MRRALTFISIFALLFGSCHNISKKKVIAGLPADTTKSFKIDKYWITPKPTFEFSAILKISHDTLALVTCAEYAYSPFGILKEKEELKTSSLKNFSVKDTSVELPGSRQMCQILNWHSNKLLLFFDHDPEASKDSYVISGEINDSSVLFSNKLKIGAESKLFYELFFDDFPKELQNRYHVIVLEACVSSVKHIYNFRNEKLASVKFKCYNCD